MAETRKPSQDFTLRIRRYDPDAGEAPYWDEHTINLEPHRSVLEGILQAKGQFDGSIGIRCSCKAAICGSCGVRVNGQAGLACHTHLDAAVKSSRDGVIEIEPMGNMPIIKDLVVDMDGFFDKFKSVQPYLMQDADVPANGRERLQSPEDRARYDDTTKCILCAACTSSCPVFWTDGQYFGPAAIVNAHRFIFDSRDDNAAVRLDILNDKEGVWRCRTTFNCTEACPRGIQVTQAISEVKQAILRGTA